MAVACVAPGTLFCCEQSAPRWFDHPFNRPRGVCDAQRGDRRKRMQNVAHGTETDHEQAKLGLGLQIPIFSQRLSRLAGSQPVHKPIRHLRFIVDIDSEAHGEQR